MINKIKTITFAAVALLLAACSGGKDRSGDVRTELMGYVPDKTAVVVSLNPQKILRSAGGDWTEDGGIVLGPYIEECVNSFGKDIKDIEPDVAKYLKIKGLNPESFLVATDGSMYKWYMLAAVQDKNGVMDYVRKTDEDAEFESKGDYEVFGERSSFLLIDNADNLMWVVQDEDADEAVKTVKNIKARAAEKAMPEWTHAYVGSGDNAFAALGSFDALGINLAGLLKMLSVPENLLGGDISYMALAYSEKDRKANGKLQTLDSEGANVSLLNQKIYDNADLSAMDLLPAVCNSKMGLGLRGSDLLSYIPLLSEEIGNPAVVDVVENIVSVAFGVGSVDNAAVNVAMYGAHAMTEFPVKGGAVVVKSKPGKSADLLSLIAENVPGIATVDDSTLRLDVPKSGMKGLEAVYFSRQGDAVVISTENLKAGNTPAGAPARTLAYSVADGKVYGDSGKFAFAAEMLKSSTGRWDSDGFFTEVEFTDKCPGMLAFICKLVNVYAADVIDAADAAEVEETIVEEFVD